MRLTGFAPPRVMLKAVVVAAGLFAACANGPDPDRSAAISAGGSSGTTSNVTSTGAFGGTSVTSTINTTGDGSATSTSTTTATGSTGGASTAATTSTSSTGGGGGGTGGTGGGTSSTTATTSGAGGSDGGVVMGLKVQYYCKNTMAMSQQANADFDILNGSQDVVQLSDLKLRYFFSDEGVPPLENDCDYAKVGCGNLAWTFGMSNGSNYLEITFAAAAGSLTAGGASGEIQARIHNTNFSVMNQVNDFSYDPTKLAFADWDKVALYQNGVLVWGTEP